ncbi:hypothetical protein CAEBREN_00674 [Caenorhabditis brenneri]|uniref:F-box domain-containing protein n=1 Tax=Caenorhabditis brenneri TaxID=135651 RepID=G0P0R7_CAEBE|nr:hypothetical protein CAEBREN_00674 [Caenorhabditis brenneri]
MPCSSKLTELLQTDERAYRTCIMYEAASETPLEEAYQNMKKVVPNLDYLDFEYWYYRFLNGNLDLNHDRSKDPKTRGFLEIPIDVVEKIIGKLGLVDRLITRKVCRNLRAVIDRQKTMFHNASIEIRDDGCVMKFGAQKIEYCFNGNDKSVLTSPLKTWFVKGDYLKMAIKEFSSIITKPNWRFKNLSFYFDWQDEDDQDNPKPFLLLNSILSKQDIHVEQLHFEQNTLVPMATLLPNFRSDVLECIDFQIGDFQKDVFEAIMEMDQWKNAKKLKLNSIPDDFDIQHLFHCKEFTIEKIDITGDHLFKIRDILFKSPNFELCTLITTGGDAEEELEELTRDVNRLMELHKEYNIHEQRYRIEDSEDYFQISCYVDEYEDDLVLEIKRVRVSNGRNRGRQKLL